MQPTQLKAASFTAYPPQANALARHYLALLQALPLVFVPILLKELITYDWKLPAERRELTRQLEYLGALSAAERASVMTGFLALSPNDDLAATDWVNNPSSFMEQLTTWLWSTHQMDRFRSVAETYASAVNGSSPVLLPSVPRLGIVVIGAGTPQSTLPLFRKLRPAGLHLNRVIPEDGLAILLAEVSRRAGAAFAQRSGQPSQQPGWNPEDPTYRHWYIDGGSAHPSPHLTQVSYARLEQPRTLLLKRIQQAIDSGGMGPEELRSLLARMRPSEIGLSDTGANAVLDHFQLTLLTEGAGTQIFATTFVQWAARECARRAQPETLLVRYAPRQQAQTMNTMLSGAKATGDDPAGSLVDADMGAYYTWLSMRRLPGAEQLRFLVWFEGHREAVAIGPDLPRGTSSDSAMDMHHVLSLIA